jgi:hypothetical protein
MECLQQACATHRQLCYTRLCKLQDMDNFTTGIETRCGSVRRSFVLPATVHNYNGALFACKLRDLAINKNL